MCTEILDRKDDFPKHKLHFIELLGQLWDREHAGTPKKGCELWGNQEGQDRHEGISSWET